MKHSFKNFLIILCAACLIFTAVVTLNSTTLRAVSVGEGQELEPDPNKTNPGYVEMPTPPTEPTEPKPTLAPTQATTKHEEPTAAAPTSKYIFEDITGNGNSGYTEVTWDDRSFATTRSRVTAAEAKTTGKSSGGSGSNNKSSNNNRYARNNNSGATRANGETTLEDLTEPMDISEIESIEEVTETSVQTAQGAKTLSTTVVVAGAAVIIALIAGICAVIIAKQKNTSK